MDGRRHVVVHAQLPCSYFVSWKTLLQGLDRLNALGRE